MIAAGLFQDAVAQVRDAVGFDDYAGALELVPTILEVGEQADAVSEQDRDEVELETAQLILGFTADRTRRDPARPALGSRSATIAGPGSRRPR